MPGDFTTDRPEKNQDEARGRAPDPEEFDYEVVDPDALPLPERVDDEDLHRGRRELEAIDEELARGSGAIARWGALIMLIAILLMLLLPRMGCTLKQHPYH